VLVSLVLDEHRRYLADTARLDAFAAALAATVRPDDVVLDLLSGTGILGLLACQAGARRVYAIEVSGIVELARELARANGFGDRFIAIHELASRAELPEPVDVIVTDGAGRFGFDAGIIEHVSDARRRFLKPGGRVIPRAITLSIAPVDTAEPYEHVTFWRQRVRGLSMDPAAAIARNTGYPRHLQREDFLAPPSQLVTFDPGNAPRTFSARTGFVVERGGTLRGIGGWFAADLAPGITLTNAPGAPNRIDRRNVFLPLREPVEVAAGDAVRVSIFIQPAQLIVRWRVEVADASGAIAHTTDASTFEGMLLPREDIARTRPEFQPRLTEAGRARKTVLDLCDGVRPLSAIESELLARHPELFADRSDAAAFVAEVVTRYSY
jgi:protein arginine N-methyltransferase 1